MNKIDDEPLVKTDQLNTQQLLELDALYNTCRKADVNTIPIYKHLLRKKRTLPCTLLLYQQQNLIGFLSAFFFYKDAYEVAIMVAPTHRRQGIATRLLREVIPIIQTSAIQNLIVSTPSHLNDAWLKTRGFTYKHCEYRMQRLPSEPLVIDDQSLTLRLATVADIPELSALDKACFSIHSADPKARFQALLQDPNYKLFIAQKNDVLVGKAHLNFQNETPRISDVAVFPRFQGQGFGGILISTCINDSLNTCQQVIDLDVETTNQNAIKLYLRFGFTVINACDFWSIPIQAMTRDED